MGAKFTFSGRIASFTEGDIIEVVAPADAVVRIHAVNVSGITETDDSTEIRLGKWTAAGTGGTTPTPNKVENGSRAFGGTLRLAATVDASGTETNSWAEGMSILAGFNKIWTPEMRPKLSPSERFVVNIVDALTSQVVIFCIEFEEEGG